MHHVPVGFKRLIKNKSCFPSKGKNVKKMSKKNIGPRKFASDTFVLIHLRKVNWVDKPGVFQETYLQNFIRIAGRQDCA
jgi:hypothetical protein